MQLHGRPRPVLDDAQRARVERGIACMLRHQEANPESWQALWVAAMGRKTIHGHAAAVDDFARAYAANPGHPDVGREYGLVLLETGSFERAVEISRQLTDANPTNAGLVANLAVAQLLANQISDAQASAERAVALDAKDPINLHLLSRIRSIAAGNRPYPRSLAELEGRR
jgi:Tfp pilus assembly protein PilF